MDENWLTITPKSSLHLGVAKPNFNFLDTRDVIPGSVIRGAVAEYFILKENANEIKNYVSNIRFGFFSPTYGELLSLQLPATALECKRHGGFKSSNNHGVFDSLLAAIAYQEIKNAGANFPVPFAFKCRQCGSRMERTDGFYVKEKNFEKVIIPHVSHTKVAINRRRDTAEPGMLYSVTAIAPRKVNFIGRIWAEMGQVKLIQEALAIVGLGGLATRGYGLVTSNFIKVELQPIEERVKLFNEQLKKIWQQMLSIASAQGLPPAPRGFYYSVDLLTPSVLTTTQGIPTLKLEPPLAGSQLIYWAASPYFLGGWSTAWGLPKETSMGVAHGSTYVFRMEREPVDFMEKAQQLESEGIGKRTDEGYGEILFCHPFHLNTREV